ncbi:type IV toxin-antitoxin system AbiEi family antitoxin domain-containing protein [Terrabacter terrae]|uniref:Type IV toxin-antitoxin system AbiEi family antitoxin domain-containing protein n=1 Tax=Terrabacter terrae TaxID=318434 RepID=A0ABN2TS23_9MICO
MDLHRLAPAGVFSAAAAHACGISGALLRSLVARGRCHPLHRGWYSVERPAGDKHRHRLRVIALLEEYGDAVMASHCSVVALLDLPDEDIDWGTVHLMWRDPDMKFRAFSRVHIHERLDHPGLQHERATVDLALAVAQVGLRSQTGMLVVADHCLHRSLITPARLAAAAHALRGQRGVTRAKAAVPWCDARHESPGETLTAQVLRELGYSFTPQFEVPRLERPGRVFHTDFRIDGTRVLIEFDGKLKYNPDVNPDAARANFQEKLREDELRRLGYFVVRLTRADLAKPALVRARVEASIRDSCATAA